MYRRIIEISAAAALVLGLALSGLPAGAQSGAPDQQSGPPSGPPEGRPMGRGRMGPEQQLQHLNEVLNLTGDQKDQVRTILQGRQQQMQSLRSDSSLSDEDRRSKMHSIMEDSNGKIRALLNDDQKQKFDQMQQHMRDRGPRPDRGENPPPSPSPQSAPSPNPQ